MTLLAVAVAAIGWARHHHRRDDQAGQQDSCAQCFPSRSFLAGPGVRALGRQGENFTAAVAKAVVRRLN